jgi:hypothetical protein
MTYSNETAAQQVLDGMLANLEWLADLPEIMARLYE